MQNNESSPLEQLQATRYGAVNEQTQQRGSYDYEDEMDGDNEHLRPKPLNIPSTKSSPIVSRTAAAPQTPTTHRMIADEPYKEIHPAFRRQQVEVVQDVLQPPTETHPALHHRQAETAQDPPQPAASRPQTEAVPPTMHLASRHRRKVSLVDARPLVRGDEVRRQSLRNAPYGRISSTTLQDHPTAAAAYPSEEYNPYRNTFHNDNTHNVNAEIANASKSEAGENLKAKSGTFETEHDLSAGSRALGLDRATTATANDGYDPARFNPHSIHPSKKREPESIGMLWGSINYQAEKSIHEYGYGAKVGSPRLQQHQKDILPGLEIAFPPGQSLPKAKSDNCLLSTASNGRVPPPLPKNAPLQMDREQETAPPPLPKDTPPHRRKPQASTGVPKAKSENHLLSAGFQVVPAFGGRHDNNRSSAHKKENRMSRTLSNFFTSLSPQFKNDASASDASSFEKLQKQVDAQLKKGQQADNSQDSKGLLSGSPRKFLFGQFVKQKANQLATDMSSRFASMGRTPKFELETDLTFNFPEPIDQDYRSETQSDATIAVPTATVPTATVPTAAAPTAAVPSAAATTDAAVQTEPEAPREKKKFSLGPAFQFYLFAKLELVVQRECRRWLFINQFGFNLADACARSYDSRDDTFDFGIDPGNELRINLKALREIVNNQLKVGMIPDKYFGLRLYGVALLKKVSDKLLANYCRMSDAEIVTLLEDGKQFLKYLCAGEKAIEHIEGCQALVNAIINKTEDEPALRENYLNGGWRI